MASFSNFKLLNLVTHISIGTCRLHIHQPHLNRSKHRDTKWNHQQQYSNVQWQADDFKYERFGIASYASESTFCHKTQKDEDDDNKYDGQAESCHEAKIKQFSAFWCYWW